MKKNQDERVYGFHGQAISVYAASAHLQWLDEFLLPWFGCEGSVEASRRVILMEDDDAHRTLSEAPVLADDHVGFVLDGPPALLESRQSNDGQHWFYDPEQTVFYHLDNKEIRILSRDEGYDGRFSLARLVRELFMEHAFASGQPVLHAAAVGYNSCGALILGNRGAGKTTLAINCVTRMGFDFIANDRAAVYWSPEGEPWIEGIPTLVRVRPMSLPLLPDLPWSQLAYPMCSREPLSRALALGVEHAGQPYLSGAVDAKFLSPAQHCWLMNTRPKRELRLGLLLFPHVDESAKGVVLQRLEPPEVLQRLAEGAFNYNATREPSRVFAGETASNSLSESRLAELAADIPAYACRLGAGAADDYGALAELFGGH
jgi:hypothetical protein